MTIPCSRKKYLLNYLSAPLFFSLVDYRNNYFISNNSDKIIEFYNGFENRDQLIQWMKERPKGVANMHEVEGNKEIIVVIPTADFNGKYAIECRENIFKGLHIIFVESGEVPDPYFNYAHNCNVGIKKAMEYNPKWVILSNDDIRSSYNAKTLIIELSKLDNDTISTVFTFGSNQTASKYYIGRFTFFGSIIISKLGSRPNIGIFHKKYEMFFNLNRIRIRFKCRYIIMGDYKKVLERFFFRKLSPYYNFEAFGIFSSRFIRNHTPLLDEIYINAHEDQDLSIIMNKENDKIAWIKYSIEGIGGSTMGSDILRQIRSLASDCYLNFKIEQGLLN